MTTKATTSRAESTSKVVYHTKGTTKTYQMGEVQFHALRGIGTINKLN